MDPKDVADNSHLATRACAASAISHPDVIATSCIPLDRLLQGGLHRSRITQVCGKDQCGKTTLCIQILINALKQGHTALWLDTCNPIHDIYKIITSHVPYSKVNQCLYIIQLSTFSHALEVLNAIRRDNAASLIYKASGPHLPDLIIWDSPTTLLAPLQGFRAHDTWTGTVAINQIGLAIRDVVRRTNSCFILTNRVLGLGSSNSNDNRPALGRFWTSLVDTNLFIEQDSKSKQNWSMGNTISHDADSQADLSQNMFIQISSKLIPGGRCQVRIDKRLGMFAGVESS